MTTHQDARNGTSTSHGTPLNIGTHLYSNGTGGFPWPYGALQQSGPQKDELAAAFGHMNFGSYAGSIGSNNSNGLMSVAMSNLIAGGHPCYQLPDGRLIPSRVSNAAFQQMRSDNSHSSSQAPNVSLSGYSNNASGLTGIASLPWNIAAHATRDCGVPELAPPRRNSFSSNEENGPRTPFIGASHPNDAHPKVVFGGSPLTWTTPSPHQLNACPPPLQIAKSPTGQYYFTDLNAICLQEPAIPKPIPAIFSGEKGRGTLEKSLQNNLNTTNVYIRGLHPNTTDEMLHSYGVRFGKIISAKSMLEQETGNCKGFGFIKYHNFTDGENCIRAFFHWGYEAKWARVSHNEKLKTLGDENNTNLYVSNLPLEFNEHSLMAVFDDFEVLSAKILRDPNGMSRGVGFARFESPDTCRKVIDQYNGVKVGDEGFILSIRFADTPEQKKLKSITAERRQYKAVEYNTAAYSPGSPYANSVPTNPYNSPLQTRPTNTFWPNAIPTSIGPLYSAYTASPSPNVAYQPPAKVPLAPGHENVDLLARSLNRTSVESPKMAVGMSKRQITYVSPAKSDIGAKFDQSYSLSSNIDIKSSPIKPSQYSPAKDSPSKAKSKASTLRS